jgi:hypothetical protein
METTLGVLVMTYSLAFLILVVYLLDAVFQWRYQDKPWKYFYGQILVALLFLIPEVMCVVYHQKEVKTAALHILQGICLLQSLIIEVSYCL